MGIFFRNLRYAVRQFSRARVFTTAAVLTLALGIGGTTAIFTLIHAVMLRSLPVGDPSRLYRIGDGTSCCVQGSPQDRWGMFWYTLFERLKAETPEFEELTAFQAGGARLSVRRQDADTTSRPLRSEYVTGNYFSTLGVTAFAGRVFTATDDTPAASPSVVLSYHLWQGIYGGDPSMVGATLFVEGRAFTVTGVTPPGFFGETLRADPPDLWIPLQHEPLINGETSILRLPFSAWLRVIGRLRPGATTDGMGARLTGVLHQWIQHDAGYPANWMPDIVRTLPQQVITVVPAGAGVGIMKEQYARSLQILLGVCALVLLIACANVANLMLARAVARRGQTAIRLAMGASRRQIVTEALVESILLALAGAIAGLIVAVGAARLLLSLAFAGATIVPIDTNPSPLVLAFAIGLALVTGIVFGVAPAWFATRTNPIDALRGAGRSTGDHASYTRTTLLVLQATVSVVLVAGSTMLARSLSGLESQNFGFEVEGRTLVALNRPPATYTAEKLAALNRDLEERLNRLPGVRGAGLALYNPLTDNWGEMVLVAGKPLPGPGAQVGASWDRVSTNYLQHLGVKLVRGRYFTDADNENTENVAVVNEAFVKRFFKTDEDPIDQHFGLNLPENVGSYRIVGIVRDAKFAGFALDRPARPMFFVALAQTVDYKQELMQADRIPVALRARAAAGHEHADRDARAAGEACARRGRSEPDGHDHQDTRAAGRALVRSTARRGQSGRPLRHRGARPGRDRAVRRHRLLGRAAHERDRPPHGARRRSRKRDCHRPARRVPPRGRRPRAGPAACGRRRLPAVRAAVRREVLGSNGAGRGGPVAGGGRVHRVHRPRRAGGGDCTDERVAGGVTIAFSDRCRTWGPPLGGPYSIRSSL